MTESILGNPKVAQLLRDAADPLGDQAALLAESLLKRCHDAPDSARRRYGTPIDIAQALLDGAASHLGGSKRAGNHRALVAAAALRLDHTLCPLALPASVRALIPAAVQRVVATLLDQNLPAYNASSDLYRKDLRFVVGYSIPCGAQDVDLVSEVPWTSLLKSPSLSTIRRYIEANGSGLWFRIHTDPRYTDEFNDAGWRRCYLRIAELLKIYPSIRGMVGTSWFYDPKLIEVSPRLAYLQSDPINGGAFMIRNGPGRIHTMRATATSPTRLALYRQGRYLPVCWSVLWPRREMLAWAHGQTTVAS